MLRLQKGEVRLECAQSVSSNYFLKTDLLDHSGQSSFL